LACDLFFFFCEVNLPRNWVEDVHPPTVGREVSKCVVECVSCFGLYFVRHLLKSCGQLCPSYFNHHYCFGRWTKYHLLFNAVCGCSLLCIFDVIYSCIIFVFIFFFLNTTSWSVGNPSPLSQRAVATEVKKSGFCCFFNYF